MSFRQLCDWRCLGAVVVVLALSFSSVADDTRDIGLDEWKSGNLIAAKTYLEKSLEEDAKDTAVRKALVDVYVRLGARATESSEEGSYWYQRALKLDPKSASAWFALGDAQFRLRSYDDALKSLLNAEKYASGKQRKIYRKRTRDVLYYRGSQRMGYNDLRGAEADYINALHRVPGDPWVMLSYGYLDILVKKPALALKKLALASAREELHARAEYYSGISWQMLKQWGKSLAHFRLSVTDPELRSDSEAGIAESQFNLAAIALKAKKWVAAEPRLVEATTLKPGWADAWFYLGQTRLGRHHGAMAKEAFLQVAKLDPKHKLLHRGLASADTLIGAARLEAGRYADAVSLFTEALQYDKGRGDAAFYLGQAEDALQHWPKALAAYQRAQSLGSFYVEAGYRRGEILTRILKQKKAALSVLEDIEQRSPNYQETRIMLTNLYDQLGNAAFAAQKWRKAIALVEKYFFFQPKGKQGNRLLLGKAYIHTQAWVKALKWLNTGYQNDGNSVAFRKYKAIAHVGYARSLYAKKRWRDAIFNFEWARELKYPDKNIDIALADSYRHLKMYSEGADLLRTLYREHPVGVDRELVSRRLVDFLVEWGNAIWKKTPAKAAGLADEALAVDGKDKAALLTAGRSHFRAGNWATARDRLEKRAKLYKFDKEGRKWLIEALLTGAGKLEKKGKENKAESLYQRVLQVDPAEKRALYALGMLYYANGKRDPEALKMLQKVLEVPEYHLQVASTIGDIHFRHQRFANALHFWDEVWEVNRSMLIQDDYLESLWQVAQGYRKQGRSDEQLERLQQGAHIARQYPLWQWRYGHALKVAGKDRKAYEYLKKAVIDLGSTQAAYLIDFGEVALEFKEWERVTLALAPYESTNPTIRNLVGTAYVGWAAALAEKSPERAEIYAAEAITRLPQLADAWYWQGVAQARQGHWKKAIASLKHAWKLEPDIREAGHELLQAWLKVAENDLAGGRLDKVEASISASEKFGKSPDQDYIRGELAQTRGDRKVALDWYRKTEAQKPDWRSVGHSIDQLLAELADIAAGNGAKEDAVGYLREIVQRHPLDRDTQIRLANLLTGLRHADEALRVWQVANKIKEDHESLLGLAATWNLKAELLLEKKDWYNAGKALNESEDWLNDADSEDQGPEAARYWYLRAQIEQYNEDWDDAAEAIDTAIRLGGANDRYRQLQQAIQAQQEN